MDHSRAPVLDALAAYHREGRLPLPGERITSPVLDHRRSGVAAGMVIPDVADASLGSLRVSVDD